MRPLRPYLFNGVNRTRERVERRLKEMEELNWLLQQGKRSFPMLQKP